MVRTTLAFALILHASMAPSFAAAVAPNPATEIPEDAVEGPSQVAPERDSASLFELQGAREALRSSPAPVPAHEVFAQLQKGLSEALEMSSAKKGYRHLSGHLNALRRQYTEPNLRELKGLAGGLELGLFFTTNWRTFRKGYPEVLATAVQALEATLQNQEVFLEGGPAAFQKSFEIMNQASQGRAADLRRLVGYGIAYTYRKEQAEAIPDRFSQAILQRLEAYMPAAMPRPYSEFASYWMRELGEGKISDASSYHRALEGILLDFEGDVSPPLEVFRGLIALYSHAQPEDSPYLLNLLAALQALSFKKSIWINEAVYRSRMTELIRRIRRGIDSREAALDLLLAKDLFGEYLFPYRPMLRQIQFWLEEGLYSEAEKVAARNAISEAKGGCLRDACFHEILARYLEGLRKGN